MVVEPHAQGAATLRERKGKPRSVLIVTLGLGGSSRLLTDLLRYVDFSAYKVTVVLLTGQIVSDAEMPPQVTVVARDFFSTLPKKVMGIVALTRLSRGHDAVMGYAEITPTYMTLLAAFVAGKRPSGGMHINLSAIFRFKLRPAIHKILIRLLYPLLRKIIACSESVADDLRRSFGLRNVIAFPNPLDLDRISAMAAGDFPPPVR